MEHPKDIGDRTTLAVMLVLQERGFAVYVPFGENTRYDLVIDDGESLDRVQCKTGRLRGGAILFKTCSTYAHHSNPGSRARDYLGQIDYFGVYCPETKGVYLVPIDDVPLRWNASLRVNPARNGQKERIRVADDFLVGTVGVGPREELGATSGA
jgi:PD-(D/E)XK endonuclease